MEYVVHERQEKTSCMYFNPQKISFVLQWDNTGSNRVELYAVPYDHIEIPGCTWSLKYLLNDSTLHSCA